MPFPEELQNRIEEEIAKIKLETLEKAAQEITKKYREERSPSKAFMSPTHRLAYAIARMPATYAAITNVLGQISSADPHSLLDLGAGPGTVFWATRTCFSHLGKITLIEHDQEFIQLGQRLAKNHNIIWKKEDLNSSLQFEPHDLVTLSYAIGELASIESLIQSAWQAANQFLVIIEPGTPYGFEKIRSARQKLIDLGANIAAPCPHTNACPMSHGNWCHFSQRLERSYYHRYVKDASLGYEDEKFSYVIASKLPVAHYDARILRHPGKHSGHITFELCTADGLKRETISRKQGELYKQARNLEWGDIYRFQ